LKTAEANNKDSDMIAQKCIMRKRSDRTDSLWNVMWFGLVNSADLKGPCCKTASARMSVRGYVLPAWMCRSETKPLEGIFFMSCGRNKLNSGGHHHQEFKLLKGR